MSEDTEQTEEFLERVKERYTVYDLIEILDLEIEEFIELTWDNILENDTIRKEVGFEAF